MGMRLSDPRWFIDRSEPALERGIRKLREERESYKRRYLEGEKICPECGYPRPDKKHCNKPTCLVGVLPGCGRCGWSPEIYGCNIMLPNPRTGFKLCRD